ncbi:MAG: lamin tail domain-containing protein, partial [Akkermansiaceae bacterium]|nr:lamin tail domain-containing protein [Verrucomicrobiales bacterium]
FIELWNPGGSVSNLSGLALGKLSDISKAWVIPSGVTIPGNGYLLIWCDGSRAAATNNAAALNTGFSLDGNHAEVVLFNALGQPVDRVNYGFQIQDSTIGRSSGLWRLLATPTPGANNSSAATLGDIAGLRLNEWMAASLSGGDWFELYNTNTLPVELSGLHLTDNPSITGITNSAIAPLSFIGPNRWVKFTADGNLSAGGDHANFSLHQEGETLRLYDTNQTLLDAVDFGLQLASVSEGRLPDGTVNLVSFFTTPSPEAANYLPLTSIVINEVLTHTDPPLEDAVELFNPTGGSVNIGGWYLSDSQNDLKRYRIPDNTTIAAGGFKVFYQNQFGPADGEVDVPPLFSFNSAHGDSVYLSEADAGGNLSGYRAEASFDAAANGVSFGRYNTSVGVDFVALSQRTFGKDAPATLAQFRSGTGTNNAYPLVGPVVINELMFHPPAWGTNSPAVEEFIELLNLTGAPVPLFDPAFPTNVWRLANAVTFDFPTNTTIPANGSLIVVAFDPVADTAALSAFRSRYGTNATLVGPYSGALNNTGEAVELWRPDAPQAPPQPDVGFVPQLLVERVIYSNTSPWPTNAAGTGASLQRLAAASYGNDPVNWTAAMPTLGNVPALPPPNAPVGSAGLPGGGIVRLSFAVQSGYTYQVEYKNALNDPQWLPLGSAVVASGSTLTADDNFTAQPRRFYRLRWVQ